VRLFRGGRNGGWSNGHERARLELLHETALGLIERLDVQQLLEGIAERAGDLVGVDDGFVYLLEPDGKRLRLRAATGRFRQLVDFRLRLGEGVSGRVAATAEPLVIDDYVAWEGSCPSLQGQPFHAVVGVPLLRANGVTGVLGLAHVDPDRTFSPEDVGLLLGYAQLGSLALENARLYEAARADLDQRRRTEEELLDTVARLSRSALELKRAHAETIRRLADAAEFRNAETGRHTERMSRYCELLARRLGLDEERCDLLRAASPLHDIGKIAVPDEILLKPGPLTPDERRTMEGHTEIGYRLLSGSSSEVLDVAATIAWTHHERWDGKGYPRGLSREAIPLEGRIAAIADVFDALTTDRVYRAALSVREAIELMRTGRATQFDPFVLDLFLELVEEAGPLAPEDPIETLALIESEAMQPDGFADDFRQRIDGRAFRRACKVAERAFEQGSGREALDLALEALVDRFDSRVLASVYVLEHGRLWLVSQKGYTEVRDGFSLEAGVMGRAVRTGTIQAVDDVRADPDYIAATSGIASEVTVPFHFGGRPAGALNVETRDAVLPRGAGTALAPLTALVGARLAEMRGRLGIDVAELVRMCVHASSLRGIGAIGEFATRSVGRILQLGAAQLDLRRDDEPRPRLVSFWRPHDAELEPLGPDVLERIEVLSGVDTGLAYSIIDARKVGVGDGTTRRIVSLPLRVGGTVVGTITGRVIEGEPSHERLEAATLFTQHAAALIDVAHALRREQRAAVTDSLTGLLNRRGFEERFQEELQRSARERRPAAIIVCDCDGLKRMNDVRGHVQGDALLELTASCFRTHKRSGDIAARYGGDEFALLLPDAQLETALAVAERLRAAISAETLAGFRLSASFGVSAYPDHGTTTTELRRAADDALYRAKQRGGDEVACGPTVPGLTN
jgi:diguanylate cyclase (GGDEF)-like protein